MTDFFTQEDIKDLEKTTSSYFDFDDGDNLIRIVSGFGKGYKFGFDHQELNKELKYPFYAPDAPEVEKYGSKLQKTFFMVIWNYQAEELQICKIHQKTILKQIKKYMDNKLYGDPTNYDLIISKSSTGKTEYSVTANPPSELDSKIKEVLENTEIVLENIFIDGKDVIVSK